MTSLLLLIRIVATIDPGSCRETGTFPQHFFSGGDMTYHIPTTEPHHMRDEGAIFIIIRSAKCDFQKSRSYICQNICCMPRPKSMVTLRLAYVTTHILKTNNTLLVVTHY